MWRVVTGADVDCRTCPTPVECEQRMTRVVELYWSKPQCVTPRTAGATTLSVAEQDTLLASAALHYPNHFTVDDTIQSRKFVPKRRDIYSTEHYEILLKRTVDARTAYEFYPVNMDASKRDNMFSFAYRMQLTGDNTETRRLEFSVQECNADSIESSRLDWIRDIFVPKLIRWFLLCATDNPRAITSLSLLNVELYARTYETMKNRYYKQLTEIWPDCTDPRKFIPEDIAIATYLATLWDTLTTNISPRFADLGCGNGLLVHLLVQQGLSGCGVDVRRRKTWDIYNGTSTVLKEDTLNPSTITRDHCLLGGTNWLIGNHSDELTPWIPVMAARLRCSFFVLPCCEWDFYGRYSKYRGGDDSLYHGYLAYVEEIARSLGFDVKRDRLKIPSTRRICFIGLWPPGDSSPTEEEVEARIAPLLSRAAAKRTKNTTDAAVFAPRAATEQCSNLSQLNRDTQDTITQRIVDQLLEADNTAVVSTTDDRNETVDWRCGGAVSLRQLAQVLTTDERALFKAQGNGIRTFVRNQHPLFVIERGTDLVRLRCCVLASDVLSTRKNASNQRTAVCCFVRFHPQGCPLTADNCLYRHTV